MAEAHRYCVVGFLLLSLLSGCTARIHNLTLENETRFVVDLNNFGFYANGTLNVNLSSLRMNEGIVNYTKYPVGFSLSRSRVNGVLSYTADEADTCTLDLTKSPNDEPLILFLIDISSLSVKVMAMGDQDNVLTAKPKAETNTGKRKTTVASATEKHPVSMKSAQPDKSKEIVEQTKEVKDEEKDFILDKPTNFSLALVKINNSYNFMFTVLVGMKAQGIYSLKFHYCYNRLPGIQIPYSFTVAVTEKNPGSFLSAAEIPLSRLYLYMAGVFLVAAIVWVHILMKHRYSVFKIHWLMAALAFTKVISLVFHSINYHFINTEGHPIEAWAVMYYITHLLKGALLFITLALIGTGWAFVKYILSDKEKKIFMIVIPLQVLANVAYIIIESTEEGSSEYNLWKEILFLVDLICCGAILFPVVWSIRHLQEASSTDGKAAMNLEKLKLFRHYYVMIVCYIYFTRIIAILLKITMPFQWQWCYEFLVEVSTLIFFVLTGYKFRPASNNPYLQLPQDEEDVEMDEVVTESGALEGISKVKKTSNGRERQKEPDAI
ncbi:protein GPR108 [Oryzias latipes]|uniref:G protein-coupled receptor 108 n=1 Tax=Oryzias latipes TaxID=8090 RepID=H2M329_ORYLA|nr:protein GPR108 [Oryzias latipes]